MLLRKFASGASKKKIYGLTNPKMLPLPLSSHAGKVRRLTMIIDAVRAKGIVKKLQSMPLMNTSATIIPQAVRNTTDSKVT